MVTEYRDWGESGAANTAIVVGDGGFPENMSFANVNNAAREMQGLLARDRYDKSGQLVTTGNSRSYVLTIKADLGSYKDGDHFRFRAHLDSTATCNISIVNLSATDLGAKEIVNTDGSHLSSKQIKTNGIYDIALRSSAGSQQFQLLNPSRPHNTAFGLNIVGVSESAAAAVIMSPKLDTLGYMGFVSGDNLSLQNRRDGNNVLLYATDTGSVLRVLFQGDPDAAATLYFTGTAKLATTTNGVDVTGTTIDLNNSGAASAGQLIVRNSEGAGRFVADGDEVTISTADPDGTSNAQQAFKAVGGGESILYYNSSTKLATTNTGIDVTGNVNPTGFFNFGPGTELTISSGAVTATGSFHSVDTESDAASDDLATINGGSAGDILIITANNVARTVVAKDGTGNLRLGGDRSLDNSNDTLTLIYDGTNWLEMAFSDNNA